MGGLNVAQRFSRARTLSDIVDSTAARWKAGENASAREVVEKHPDIVHHRSILFDLVLKEFSYRRAAGEMLGPLTYREQFESFGLPLAQSIERVIALQDLAEVPSQECQLKNDCWPKPGNEFGRFLVVEELGRGSFARVYHCLERGIGDRPVAVKVSYSGSREADRLGRLSHPNIVPILTAFFDPSENANVTVMPLLAKFTLADVSVLANSVTPKLQLGAVRRQLAQSFGETSSALTSSRLVSSYERWLLSVAYEVAAALEYSHAEGVIHCDIKPSNILITAEALPLLIDFNLSCVDSADLGVIGGTLEYMPPEFWQSTSGISAGDAERLPPSAGIDVFSFAVTFAEAVVGHRPISHGGSGSSCNYSPDEAIAKQQALVSCAVSKGPWSELKEILEGCISVAPSNRPNIAEVKTSLQKLAEPHRASVQKPWMSRRELILAATGVLPVAAVAQWTIGSHSASNELLKDAIEYYEAGRFAESESLVNDYLRENPGSVRGRYLSGWLNFQRGNFLRAASHFGDIFNEKPNDTHFASCVGLCYVQLGEHQQAYRWYHLAEIDAADDYSVANNIGCCYWLVRDSRRDLGYGGLTKDPVYSWFDVAIQADHAAIEPRLNQISYLLTMPPSEIREVLRDFGISADQLVQENTIRDHTGSLPHVSALLLAKNSDTSNGIPPLAKALFKQAVEREALPSRDNWNNSPLYASFQCDPAFGHLGQRLTNDESIIKPRFAKHNFRQKLFSK